MEHLLHNDLIKSGALPPGSCMTVQTGRVPKEVDHDARRREIARAYLEVVARDGAMTVTSRALAAHYGIGPGALWHYFPNLDAVLIAAWDLLADDIDARINAAVGELTGLDAALVASREIMPHGSASDTEVAIAVAFWRLVPDRRDLAERLIHREGRWRVQIRGYLADAVRLGDLKPDAPVGELSDMLWSVAYGALFSAVLHTELADPVRQKAVIDACLSPWRTTTSRLR